MFGSSCSPQRLALRYIIDQGFAAAEERLGPEDHFALQALSRCGSQSRLRDEHIIHLFFDFLCAYSHCLAEIWIHDDVANVPGSRSVFSPTLLSKPVEIAEARRGGEVLGEAL